MSLSLLTYEKGEYYLPFRAVLWALKDRTHSPATEQRLGEDSLQPFPPYTAIATPEQAFSNNTVVDFNPG